MKFLHSKVALLCVAVIQIAALTSYASAQLKAGAARTDITPAVADLPLPFTSIGTPIYARALVLENAGKRVVIVLGDLPTIASPVLDDLIKRISATAGAPPENVIMAVTHTHNGVRLDDNPLGGVLPGSAAITKITGGQIIDCVRNAVANLQPARAGYMTGIFHLGNARATGQPQPSGAAQGQSQEPAALGVFKVESTAGDLIALLVNGGPEPVMGMSMNTKIGSDVAGVMERYIEQRFSDKAVVLYTVGSPPQLVINSRQRIPGATPADLNALMSAVGTILGEEALATASRVKTSPELMLSGALQVLTCPGKATTPLNNAASCSDAPDSKLPKCVFTDKDTGPVDLRIGLIRLGDLSIINTDSNIGWAVWQQVKSQAPSPANTMLAALTYGPTHYVIPDSEYATNSYQATAAMVKRGCAEKGFVDDALKMLKAAPTGSN